MVEMAIILPILLALVLGMMDFGLLLRDYLALNHVARHVARQAAVGDVMSNGEIKVLGGTFGLKTGSEWNDTDTSVDVGNGKGDQITVTLSYNHSMVVAGSTKTLGTTMVMRREYD